MENAVYFPRDTQPEADALARIDKHLDEYEPVHIGRTPTPMAGCRKAVLFQPDLWDKILVIHGRTGQPIREIVNQLIATGLEVMY